MININNYFILLFFFTLFFFTYISPLLISFIILGELLWIIIFSLGSLDSLAHDSLVYLGWVILFLCLAAGESVIGLSFLMFRYTLYNCSNNCFLEDFLDKNFIFNINEYK